MKKSVSFTLSDGRVLVFLTYLFVVSLVAGGIPLSAVDAQTAISSNPEDRSVSAITTTTIIPPSPTPFATTTTTTILPIPSPFLTTTTTTIPLQCPPAGDTHYPGQCAVRPTTLSQIGSTEECVCCPGSEAWVNGSCSCPAGTVQAAECGNNQCGYDCVNNPSYGPGFMRNCAVDGGGGVRGCSCVPGTHSMGQAWLAYGVTREVCGYDCTIGYGPGYATDCNRNWGGLCGCNCISSLGLIEVGGGTCGWNCDYWGLYGSSSVFRGFVTDGGQLWGGIVGCGCPAGTVFIGNDGTGIHRCGQICTGGQIPDCSIRNGEYCGCSCPYGTVWDGSSCVTSYTPPTSPPIYTPPAPQCYYILHIGSRLDFDLGGIFNSYPSAIVSNLIVLRPDGSGECSSALQISLQNIAANQGYGVPIYIDESCRLTSTSGKNLCGVELVINNPLSPISLLWDSSVDMQAMPTLSTFPINPENPSKYYSWKASAKAPLLVFDPDHSGVINSASQLFGNYTFGKKWADGYQALASLDQDRDGSVSGAELQDLGLWFDVNRNGISEAGEVKDLADVGLSALYYEKATTIPGSRDLYMIRGYTRIKDGKPQDGMSVDWYAAPFETKIDFLNYWNSKSVGESGADMSANQVANKVNLEELLSSNKYDPSTESNTGLAGSWLWTSDSAVEGFGPISRGGLYFNLTDEEVTGTAMAIIPLQPNSDRVHTMVEGYPISGRILKKESGEIKFAFKVVGKHGLKTSTVAKLNLATNKIDGYSRSNIGVDGAGKPISIEYSWTARRFASSASK